MRNKAQVPTAAQVKADMEARGINCSAWARERGFSRWTVLDLLNGRVKGRYGEAHRAAVALGLKPDPAKKAA